MRVYMHVCLCTLANALNSLMYTWTAWKLHEAAIIPSMCIMWVYIHMSLRTLVNVLNSLTYTWIAWKLHKAASTTFCSMIIYLQFYFVCLCWKCFDLMLSLPHCILYCRATLRMMKSPSYGRSMHATLLPWQKQHSGSVPCSTDVVHSRGRGGMGRVLFIRGLRLKCPVIRGFPHKYLVIRGFPHI